MEELRKAGLELPPPPSEIELPKKEFGVFVEPTAAAQVTAFDSGIKNFLLPVSFLS